MQVIGTLTIVYGVCEVNVVLLFIFFVCLFVVHTHVSDMINQSKGHVVINTLRLRGLGHKTSRVA